MRLTRRAWSIAIVLPACLAGVCIPRSSPAASPLYETGGMPYRAFAELPREDLRVGDAVLRIAFATAELDRSKPLLRTWIRNAAKATAGFYGRFPVDGVQILVLPIAGAGVRTGATYGYRGAAIKVRVGVESTERHFARDWVLTHEMVHLALPGLRADHTWLEEGIATYVEPIARAQAGQLSAEAAWRDLVSGLPKGLPQAGDRGLDHTPTWGRTYWGGALFCLLADVEIRERTANKAGLQDALRAVNRAGGTVERRWPIARVLELGDEATGVRVLQELYARMKAAPVEPDLDDLWERLGVRLLDRAVVFDDDAPLAAVRRAITDAGG